MWVRIDDQFYDHPKWVDAPGDSIALWIAAMAWCNRNNSLEGYIPTSKLSGLVKVRNLQRTVTDLANRGAFHGHRDGWLIHDYSEYQQNERVQQIRAKRAAAGRKGAAARWHNNQMANAIPDAMASECPVPVPVPVPGPYLQSPPSLDSLPADPGDGTDDRIRRIATRYAELVADATPNVRSRPQFLRHLHAQILSRPHPDARVSEPEIVYLAILFPTAPPEVVAVWLTGDKGTMRQYPRADELDGSDQ